MLTTAEVAVLLDVSPRRVRALKVRIGYTKAGRDLLFEREAVEKFKQSRKLRGTASPDPAPPRRRL